MQLDLPTYLKIWRHIWMLLRCKKWRENAFEFFRPNIFTRFLFEMILHLRSRPRETFRQNENSFSRWENGAKKEIFLFLKIRLAQSKLKTYESQFSWIFFMIERIRLVKNGWKLRISSFGIGCWIRWFPKIMWNLLTNQNIVKTIWLVVQD